jgi:hypothetical protein
MNARKSNWVRISIEGEDKNKIKRKGSNKKQTKPWTTLVKEIKAIRKKKKK